MPDTSSGMKMPEGISLQDMMKSGALPGTANGHSDTEGADETPSVACKECGGSSKTARACGGCWQVGLGRGLMGHGREKPRKVGLGSG